MTKIDTATDGLPLFEMNRTVTDEDVQAIVQHAKEMRAAMVADMLKGIFRPLKSALRARRTARSLNGLSDAVLADIGIERSQIPSISKALAEGTFAQPTAEVTVIQPAVDDADHRQPELPLAA